VPAVRTTKRCANAKAALSEVQSIAGCSADAIVLCPYQMRLIDAALQHQIFEQPPDRVVCQCSDDCSLQAEASPQAASNVVLAAPLPYIELAGGSHPHVAGIEPQHYLAKADQVPHALVLRAYYKVFRISRRIGHASFPFKL
jgi:hypothetical protein